MPELPEVETICNDLKKVILKKTIINHSVLLKRSFLNDNNLDIYGEIESINRIGKYIEISIKNKCKLLIHLRMTGKLIFQENCNENVDNHVKIIFIFSENQTLIFHDVRTFGFVEVVPINYDVKVNKKIGIDALSDCFNLEYFMKIINKNSIKNLLLDQTKIAGIGNIYVQEILFYSNVSPLRSANSLTKNELLKIISNTKKILKLAIKKNGTSISDYRRVDNKTGEFQNFLKVYGKVSCSKCHQKLTLIKLNGRVTRFCANCQI
jgi:formamidopyrimidine-DNA glycosylase